MLSNSDQMAPVTNTQQSFIIFKTFLEILNHIQINHVLPITNPNEQEYSQNRINI
jgi:hypothetical protein